MVLQMSYDRFKEGKAAISVPFSFDPMGSHFRSVLFQWEAHFRSVLFQWEAHFVQFCSNGKPTYVQFCSGGKPTSVQFRSNGNPSSVQFCSNGKPTSVQFCSHGKPSSVQFCSSSVLFRWEDQFRPVLFRWEVPFRSVLFQWEDRFPFSFVPMGRPVPFSFAPVRSQFLSLLFQREAQLRSNPADTITDGATGNRYAAGPATWQDKLLGLSDEALCSMFAALISRCVFQTAFPTSLTSDRETDFRTDHPWRQTSRS